MERLDEAALRREDFAGGTPVQLADGQDWSLRKPIVRYVPADNDNGFETRLTLAGDDEFPALLARWDRANEGLRAGEERSGTALIAAELALGRAILTANYTLTPEQVGSLLAFGYDPDGDPDGWALRNDVMAVVRGDSPKRSGDGGESAPSPTG